MIKEPGTIDKDSAFQTLELTNSWISNADTKISLALAFIGVLIGFVFSGDTPNIYKTIYDLKQLADITFLQIVNGLFVTGLYITCFLCVLELLRGIKAKISNNNSSLFFFGTISKKNVSEYINTFLASNEETILRDISEQIHTNSKICAEKFKHYNNGIRWLICSTVLWFVVSVLQVM